MRRPRIFVAQALAGAENVALGEAAARHITRVLRLAPGAPLTLFDGRGGEYDATLAAVERGAARVRVECHRAAERESALQITLAQAVTRGERMDITLQKGVELGVCAIAPLLSERCAVRLSGERLTRRREHWQAVILGACEQSGRNRVPALLPLAGLSDWLARSGAATAGLCICLDPQAPAALGDLPPPAGPVTLLVGPEGGLTRHEVSAAAQAGFHRVRLGPRILRTETAAIAGLAALQTLWGDMAR